VFCWCAHVKALRQGLPECYY